MESVREMKDPAITTAANTKLLMEKVLENWARCNYQLQTFVTKKSGYRVHQFRCDGTPVFNTAVMHLGILHFSNDP